MNRLMKINNRVEQKESTGDVMPGAITRLRRMLADERGAVGVKEIAITVAVIVIIGAVVSLITGSFLNTWISEIWNLFIGLIKDMTTS